MCLKMVHQRLWCLKFILCIDCIATIFLSDCLQTNDYHILTESLIKMFCYILMLLISRLNWTQDWISFIEITVHKIVEIRKYHYIRCSVISKQIQWFNLSEDYGCLSSFCLIKRNTFSAKNWTLRSYRQISPVWFNSSLKSTFYYLTVDFKPCFWRWKCYKI